MCFFFNESAPTEYYTYVNTLSLHDALPIAWIEQGFGPAISFAHEQAPLVQAMLAILPKFYSLGNDAEAGPMRWAGNLLPLEPRLHLFEACLERMAVVERAGQIGRAHV